MQNMYVAMGMITVCLMLVIKLSYTVLTTLKAKYVAQGSINAIQLLEDDQKIDAISDNKKQALARLSYKIRRDKLLSKSKVLVANAIAKSN